MSGRASARPRVIARTRAAEAAQRPRSRPTVTVVIPCYNYARFLPGAVESALSQRDVSVDVVVVDDVSTDDSLAVAHSLAAADPRVRVIAHEVNQGPVATFNDGLAVATGEYLIRLDADDLLTPGSVARATALAERHPSVAFVYGHPVHFADGETPEPRAGAAGWTVWSGTSWLELRCRLGVNCITSPEVLMRASVVDRLGGQRALAHTHDMEMWFRMARDGDVGWVSGVDQALHREHSSSLSARQVDVLTDLHERAEAFEVLFTDGIGDPAEDARLLDVARRALANEAIARASQAYVRGRGGSAETEALAEFATGLGVDLDALPHGRIYRKTLRLGPERARRSPELFVRALLYRAVRELRGARWRSTGL